MLKKMHAFATRSWGGDGREATNQESKGLGLDMW
jgi:hypothetical protein